VIIISPRSLDSINSNVRATIQAINTSYKIVSGYKLAEIQGDRTHTSMKSSFFAVFLVHLERNISKTAGFRDTVPKDHQWEMAYGLSNGRMTDDIT